MPISDVSDVMKIELVLEDERVVQIETDMLPKVGQKVYSPNGACYLIDFKEIESPTNPIPRFQASEIDAT